MYCYFWSPQISRQAFIDFCKESGDASQTKGGYSKEEREVRRRLQKAVTSGRIKSFGYVFNLADRLNEVSGWVSVWLCLCLCLCLYLYLCHLKLFLTPCHVQCTCLASPQGHISEAQLATALRTLRADFNARDVTIMFRAAAGRHSEMDLSSWMCVRSALFVVHVRVCDFECNATGVLVSCVRFFSVFCESGPPYPSKLDPPLDALHAALRQRAMNNLGTIDYRVCGRTVLRVSVCSCDSCSGCFCRRGHLTDDAKYRHGGVCRHCSTNMMCWGAAL